MNDTAIEFDNISYAYRSDWLLHRIPSIVDVNLKVVKGEVFGFLGHNGAGKTTTIKCALNLVTPQKGSVSIFGKESTDMHSRLHVGYVPEQPYFYDHLTVYEILDMYASLTEIESAKRATAVEEALSLVGMQKRSKSRMRSLSKGLTQRIAMAQAIVAKPKLLILDEPFSGLDPLGRKEFVDLIHYLRDDGCTVFLSSHILSDVEQLCDRVSIMREGELQGIFSMSEVKDLTHGHYELVVQKPSSSILDLLPEANETASLESSIRLHYPQESTAREALALCLSNNASISSFSFVHGGLEELFIKLVNPKEAQ